MNPGRSWAIGILCLLMLAHASPAVDFVAAPLGSETVVSPNGLFAFNIRLARQWRRDPATGTLHAVRGAHREVVWQRQLPQPVRPRFALVANDGAVALFDQFDNVKGPIAILLLDPQGVEIKAFTFDDIARATGILPSEIAHLARHGVWLETPPVLLQGQARMAVGGRALAIDLQNGDLRLIVP